MPTSVKRPQQLLFAIACGLFTGPVAPAAIDEPPDIEFLDYLGSWDESDADWQLVKAVDRLRAEARKIEQSESAPAGEASTEIDDEQ